QDKISDPILLKQVRAFIGQEAHHGKEHDALNAMMLKKGYPVALDKAVNNIVSKALLLNQNSGISSGKAKSITLTGISIEAEIL
ncbi:metal-dependent hydrolase, partial [Acinetobacter baumannii]|uniref:metal-dependent hydrolase n=1 Tax=Acinetobacter baumannii TaxID=470 RepID=UPI001CB87EDA